MKVVGRKRCAVSQLCPSNASTKWNCHQIDRYILKNRFLQTIPSTLSLDDSIFFERVMVGSSIWNLNISIFFLFTYLVAIFLFFFFFKLCDYDDIFSDIIFQKERIKFFFFYITSLLHTTISQRNWRWNF